MFLELETITLKDDMRYTYINADDPQLFYSGHKQAHIHMQTHSSKPAMKMN